MTQQLIIPIRILISELWNFTLCGKEFLVDWRSNKDGCKVVRLAVIEGRIVANDDTCYCRMIEEGSLEWYEVVPKIEWEWYGQRHSRRPPLRTGDRGRLPQELNQIERRHQ